MERGRQGIVLFVQYSRWAHHSCIIDTQDFMTRSQDAIDLSLEISRSSPRAFSPCVDTPFTPAEPSESREGLERLWKVLSCWRRLGKSKILAIAKLDIDTRRHEV